MSKFMRMIVFFDLPVGTARERKAATKFRNFLIKDGYHMVQYSVYSRICNGNDAVEFMLAGAKAISIGCGNFIDPYAAPKTVEGIADYLKRHNIEDVNDIVGKLKMN